MVRKIENSGDDKNDKHMSEQYLLIIHRPGLRNFFWSPVRMRPVLGLATKKISQQYDF